LLKECRVATALLQTEAAIFAANRATGRIALSN